MRVFGRIEDAHTEKLLTGAIVTLKVGDTELIEHTPSKDGHFAYEIPDAAVPIDAEVLTCIIERNGYKTQTSTYTITGNDIELAVELVPDPINWKRIFITVGIILGGLLLLAAIALGIKFFFFGPKEYPIKSLLAKPARIDAGDEAEITWDTIEGDAVFIDKDQVEPTGSMKVKPAETQRFQLIVRDEDGIQLAAKSVEIKVIPPPPPPPTINGFTATPMEINLWESTLLEWKTTGAETVYIYGDTGGQSGPLDLDAKMITLDDEAVEESQDEDKTGQKEGGETEKNNKDLNGSVEVFPMKTTTFTLAAINSRGVKRETSIEVRVLSAPEIVSFTTGTHSIDPGESVILNWETENAEQVFLNGERIRPRFSLEVRPGETTTYKLTARNKAAERHNTLIVTVRGPGEEEPAPPPKPPQIHRFQVSSPVIAPGEPTLISWVTDHADKVYLTVKTSGINLPPSVTGAATQVPKPAKPTEPTETGKETAEKKPGESADKQDTAAGQEDAKEIIAGRPLQTGKETRVKPVDSLQVSPRVTTLYQLRAVNALKEIVWTRTVTVKPWENTVFLYELENYKGDYMRFTSGAADIGKMNNRVSSIRVFGNCGVKVFSAPNFQATYQEFRQSVPRLRGTWIGNDTVSSFKIIDQSGAEQ